MRGEHDVFTAAALRSAVDQPLAAAVPVVIDMREATFIDSSVLAVLLGGLRRAREQQTGFALVLDDEQSPIRRILEVTGLIPVFPLYSSVEDAIDAAVRPVE
jgi:anti-anti-sigma factor